MSGAIVDPRKISHALYLGNLDGVRRLARFVCAESADPWKVFDACEQQRIMGFIAEEKRNAKR
jgi:hypothetical protein